MESVVQVIVVSVMITVRKTMITFCLFNQKIEDGSNDDNDCKDHDDDCDDNHHYRKQNDVLPLHNIENGKDHPDDK